MATGNPEPDDNNHNLNAAENNYEQRVSGSTENTLRQAENNTNDINSANNQSGEKIRQKENEGDKEPNAPWVQNYSKETGKTFNKAKFWKRTGIIGGGGGIIGLILFFISGFLPLGGILLNLGEVATANRDTQNNILTKRLYKTIDAKIGGDMTSGSCNVVKIACRFSRPSNALITRLSDYGIEAIGKDGKPIEKKALGFPNEKPQTYRFKGQDIDAKSFTKTLGSNVEFRKAFTSAFNMRYWGYADSVIKKLFYKKAGIDRSGKALNDIDAKDPHKTVKTLADGSDRDNKIKNASGEEAKKSAATQALTEGVVDEAEKASKKIVNSKGDPILLAGTAVCIGINMPGMFAKVAWLYQKRQELLLASTFVLTASSMLKTGDMKPEQMAAIGTMLTASSIVNGKKTKSAMDSAGIRNILFNDNISSKNDGSLARFIPGKSARDATSGITAFAQNEDVKKTCSAIQSVEAQAAVAGVEAGLAGATGGIGGVLIGVAKGVGAVFATAAVADLVLSNMKPFIEQGVQTLVSSLTAEQLDNLVGNPAIGTAKEEDFGNVLGGGLNYFYTDAALSTGSKPLTTSQLASYQKETQDTMIAYAEQDRAGRNPLDISSPYTFLGSIFANYYKNAYFAGNTSKTILSSIGYTLGQPFHMFSNNTYAATDNISAQYTHAAEFGASPDIAVGPYGNVAAGIPTQYSDISTQELVNSVSDQISDTTGQPKDDSNIKTSLDSCSDGDVYSAGSCAITNQESANESLYLYDLRINDMLDGTNTDKEESSSTSTAAGATVDEENLFNDSTQIGCAPGTTEARNDTGYKQGNPIPVKLCVLPNTILTDTREPALVNSRASGVAYAMFEKMKADLGLDVIALNDSFRTMAQQEEAKRIYGGGAASPGYSNHQMGYAFDVHMGGENKTGQSPGYSAGVNTSYPGNKVWEWLKANAGTYHFMQLPSEGWHWSINGG